MKAAAVLLAALLLQDETSPPIPIPTPPPLVTPSPTPSPGGDFSFATYSEDEYLVAEVNGTSETYDNVKKEGRIRNGRATYYTRPRSIEEKSRKVTLDFPVADIDGKVNRFFLPEGGTVRMEDGSTLEASELLLEYATQRLTSGQPVRLTRPGVVLTGAGLEADDALKQLTIPKDGYLEIQGRPEDYAPDRPATPPDPTLKSILRSKGTLVLRELPGPERFFFVSAEGGVQLDRTEGTRTLQTTADSLVLYLARGGDGYRPVSVTARGAISISDSEGMRATASSLDWESRDDRMFLTQVDFGSGPQKIRSDNATLDRWTGIGTFTGNLSAEVAPEPDQPPLKITAKELEIGMAPGLAVSASHVVARGDVRISGDFGTPAAPRPLEAVGTEFSWDAYSGSGRLFGRPFARIVQGESLIQAPLIVFEGRSLIVIKGPKSVNFAHTEPPALWRRNRNTLLGRDPKDGGKRTEIALSTPGDIRYDAVGRTLTVLDRCEVRTAEFQLAADRVLLRLGQDGDGIEEARAFGRVRMQRPVDGVRLLGDAVNYLPAQGVIEIVGSPRAFATVKEAEISAPFLRYDQATQTVTFGRRR